MGREPSNPAGHCSKGGSEGERPPTVVHFLPRNDAGSDGAARPYRFFLGLWRNLRPRGLMRMLTAERAGGGRVQFLEGSILLMYGQTVHYALTGCRTESLGLHVNDLLKWEVIQRAHRKGIGLCDFREAAEERHGLADFKSKWCAKPVLLYRYRYPGVTGEAADASAL